MQGTQSVSQHNMGVNIDGQIGELGQASSIVDGCIVLHIESLRDTQGFLQQYTVYGSNLDIQCYPFIVGKLVGFLDKLVVCGEPDVESKKPDLEDENSLRPELELHGVSDEVCSCESSRIPLDHFPFTTFENLSSLSNLENVGDDVRLRSSRTLYLGHQKLRDSRFNHMEIPKMLSDRIMNCNIHANYSVQDFIDSGLLLANVNLQNITVHFHDSSYILGTVLVPSAESLFTISADSLDIVCSTEGVVLSTSWWSQINYEFLWGPLYSNLSPILNLSLKKRNTGLRTFQLEMSFHVQQVSCILPPEVLAMFIGYFSRSDWNPFPKEQPSDGTSFEDSSTIIYNFEIVDCNAIIPANSDCSELLKANLKQLHVAFSQNSDRSSVIKDIPSACCIDAVKFPDRNLCLDFFGCDLSLSLMLKEEHMVNSLDECQNLILIASLSADVWVRIPVSFEADVASSNPVCIMAMIKGCQLDIEGVGI